MKTKFHSFLLRGVTWALCLCAVLISSATLGDEARLPDQPRDYAAVIRPQLPAGWRCTYDFSTLIISHDEQVTFLNMVGLPSSERNDAFFKEYGIQGPYLIVMKFVPRLSDADQRALADRRRQGVEEAEKRGGRVKGNDEGRNVYKQHFVPEYFSGRHSIDLQKSDSGPLALVAPADAVKQRDAILMLLLANLQKYPARP